jgi:hypothetical protein
MKPARNERPGGWKTPLHERLLLFARMVGVEAAVYEIFFMRRGKWEHFGVSHPGSIAPFFWHSHNNLYPDQLEVPRRSSSYSDTLGNFRGISSGNHHHTRRFWRISRSAANGHLVLSGGGSLAAHGALFRDHHFGRHFDHTDFFVTG